MLMFDSLNRHFLPTYGCDWVHAPNFERLAERSATFNNSYVGSMPCMPARRELHTGRPNFLHRGWGPLEPFDDSVPEMLKRNGIYTHLVSDHYHYWEDGGCTYHQRYNTWECIRGQEGDLWIGQVADPEIPPTVASEQRTRMPGWRQDWINRRYMRDEENHTLTRTVNGGLEFLRRNHDQDNWFLHVECFDPHEPFFAPQKYRDLYPHEYHGAQFDWPPYRPVGEETPEQINHIRYEYAALLSMVDAYLGKVLDLMDELDLWKDTLLIVNTDHGHMLGEHNCWAKCWQPWYDELANSPLFIWDPRSRVAGVRRNSLVQNIDWGPTLLDYFGVQRTKDMIGKPLRDTVADDAPVRRAGLFGNFGSQVNVTDGRYVYMRASAREDNQPLFEYTLMPTRMNRMFSVEELQDIGLAEPLSFTKGCRVMKIPTGGNGSPHIRKTLLFDKQTDPKQQNPLSDPEIEKKMIAHLVEAMRECDAPPEQFERLGLEP